MSEPRVPELKTLGWREWLALPSLGIGHIKAKVDTGARTSSLHAFFIDPFERDGDPWVRFGIHPWQGRDDIVVEVETPVFDRRQVSDSGGHREMRYVIVSELRLGNDLFEAELTLTNRDTMKFRMLLGRTALAGRYRVDPALSFRMGQPPKSEWPDPL